MVQQPWQTEEQIGMQNRALEEYRKFTDHIFEQDVKKAKRGYQGTSVWDYIYLLK